MDVSVTNIHAAYTMITYDPLVEEVREAQKGFRKLDAIVVVLAPNQVALPWLFDGDDAFETSHYDSPDLVRSPTSLAAFGGADDWISPLAAYWFLGWRWCQTSLR